MSEDSTVFVEFPEIKKNEIIKESGINYTTGNIEGIEEVYNGNIIVCAGKYEFIVN